VGLVGGVLARGESVGRERGSDGRGGVGRGGGKASSGGCCGSRRLKWGW